MGTSLTRIQVYLGGQGKKMLHATVVETARQRVLEGPFIEALYNKVGQADREVIVGALGEAPWLTVVDTQGDMRELGQRISIAIKGTVIFINLIDSDIVHLRRYHQGKIVSEYCNGLVLYDDNGHVTKWEPKQSQGALLRDYAQWEDLFVSSIDLQRLHRVMGSKPIFADDILWAFVDAFGMNADEVAGDFEPETITRLAFRVKQQRLYEIEVKGPPKLSVFGRPDVIKTREGERLDLVVTFQNGGGASTGINVYTWGSALDEGVVEIQEARVAQTGILGVAKGATWRLCGTKGQGRRYVATFDDFQLPGGIMSGLQAVKQQGVDREKALDAVFGAQFSVRLLGLVKTAGRGEILVSCEPHSNREGGEAGCRIFLVASAASQ